jgi:hypothetical protein
MNRRLIIAAWLASIAAAMALTLYPLNSSVTKAAWLLSIISALALPLLMWPRSWLIRTIVFIGIAAPVVLLSLPGRSYSRAALRASSVNVLHSFDGTRYLWGGEGRSGIDCSGLVRQALIRSSLKQGLSSLDGDLVRLAAALWWFDSSARSLRDGYRDQTTFLLEAPTTNAVPTDLLAPGDFAVTSDGVHVLAYLGERRWIEADPTLGRVVTLETPTTNPWFSRPVHIMRWKALAE